MSEIVINERTAMCCGKPVHQCQCRRVDNAPSPSGMIDVDQWWKAVYSGQQQSLPTPQTVVNNTDAPTPMHSVEEMWERVFSD